MDGIQHVFNFGNNILPFFGVVENNLDERLEGRVQVRAFGIHGTTEEIPTADLPWAIRVMGTYDYNTPPPPLNSWVFGFFLDGRAAQQMIIVGVLGTQMTNPADPRSTGWGAPVVEDYNLLSYGSRSQDMGQPGMSPLARGENTENTYVLAQEVCRVTDVPGPNGTTWSEPSTAYAAQYPFNRVIETPGGHSIEMDDTPGAERIMIYHKSGSYVQIDPRGTKTDKSASDKFEINEMNYHIYVGGQAMVNIEGDAHVKIGGNKFEEIGGDCVQVVHGNYELSVAGQLNLNGSDEIQARAAKVTVESNVEDVSIKAGKQVRIEAGEKAQIKSLAVAIEGSDTADIKSTAVKIGGGDKVSVSASEVALDDIVRLASGDSDTPGGAEGAKSAVIGEPASKSVSFTAGSDNTYVNGPSMGSAGYASVDGDMGSEYSSDYTDNPTIENPGAVNSSCSTDLTEFIKTTESFHAKPYHDVRQWTNGYGTEARSPNEIIDKAEATRRLSARINLDRIKVANYGKSMGYSWNDCQIDALTSFVYNLGFETIKQLTHNGKLSNDQIAENMLTFNKARVKGKLQVMGGLVKRRAEESAWFRDGTIK